MWTWIADLYDSIVAEPEAQYFRKARYDLLHATEGGACLEIGAGTGASLPAWPSTTKRLVLTEPSAAMRKHLQEKLHEGEVSLPVKPEVLPVRLGGPGSFPFDDNKFDVILVSLIFCGIKNPEDALQELQRVTKPGGKICFVEHVIARPGTWVRFFAPFINWIWLLFFQCSAMRDTHKLLERTFPKLNMRVFVMPFSMTGIDNHCIAATATVEKK